MDIGAIVWGWAGIAIFGIELFRHVVCNKVAYLVWLMCDIRHDIETGEEGTEKVAIEHFDEALNSLRSFGAMDAFGDILFSILSSACLFFIAFVAWTVGEMAVFYPSLIMISLYSVFTIVSIRGVIMLKFAEDGKLFDFYSIWGSFVSKHTGPGEARR